MSQTPDAPEGQVFTPAERRITVGAVMLVFFLSAMDQTIVSTAMPRIVAQLQGLNLYAWVTTAYMLSSTVTVPIYGRLNDLFGRKPVLLSGIAVFLIGSMLCGMAGEFGDLPLLGGGMTQLIVFRAIQGLGGGALFTTAFAIISDLFPPRERAKFAGLFGAVFGIASLFGPVIGGFFTDMGDTNLFGLAVAGWRWVFYVNIPLGLLAVFFIVAKMPVLTHRAPGRIDVIGAVLIVTAFVPLLLALGWAGRDYAWDSPMILGLFALFAVSLVAFVLVEAKVAHPLVSIRLFRNKVFTTANLANFFSSTAFMGSITFLPLYMQLGQGVPATTSGLSMVPLTLGMIATSTICGQLVTRTAQYKPFMLAGAVGVILGLLSMTQLDVDSTTTEVAWRALLLGLGLGPTMSLFNVAIQNAVERNEIGVATSATQFFRQIGGAVGVGAFGAVLTAGLGGATLPPEAPGLPARVLDLPTLERMAAAQMATGGEIPLGIRTATAHAVQVVMMAGAGVAVLAFICVLMIPAIGLAGRGPEPKASGPADKA